MKKNEALQRIQKLIDEKSALENKEKEVAKAVIKARVKLAQSEEEFKARVSDVKELQQQHEELKKQNDVLKALLSEGVESLEELKLEQEQREEAEPPEQASSKQQVALAFLEKATNVRLNLDATPDVMQGFVVKKRDSHDECIPFSSATQTIEEIQNIIWDSTNSPYADEWEKLFSDAIFKEANTMSTEVEVAPLKLEIKREPSDKTQNHEV